MTEFFENTQAVFNPVTGVIYLVVALAILGFFIYRKKQGHTVGNGKKPRAGSVDANRQDRRGSDRR